MNLFIIDGKEYHIKIEKNNDRFLEFAEFYDKVVYCDYAKWWYRYYAGIDESNEQIYLHIPINYWGA